MKHKTTFEAFVAGAILKFGNVDTVDLFILIMMANNYDLELVSGKIGVLNRFIDYNDTSVALKDGFNLESDISPVEGIPFTLERRLKMLSGNNILEFINNLDLKEFMLRKIKILNGTTPIKISSNELEEQTLEELENDGYVIKIVAKTEDAYLLTKKGQVYLFKQDNALALEENNYNREVIDSLFRK